MEARLVKIGNSKGIRLPKAMLQQTGMTEWIEIEAKGGNIILKPIKQPRSGWEESFVRGGDKLNAEDRAWLNAELVSVEGESW